MEDKREYQCACCGRFINDEDGVTTLEGLWICDKDECRTLNDDNDATINTQVK
jgi:hypothetical protein